MDQVQESKKSKDSKYWTNKYGTTDKAMKNSFRYRRADFRQSKAYEKFEILTSSTSYPRPPTPIFDDFDSPFEANQVLTSWMESIYKEYPRYGGCLVSKGEMQNEIKSYIDGYRLSKSRIITKEYQKRSENLVSA